MGPSGLGASSSLARRTRGQPWDRLSRGSVQMRVICRGHAVSSSLRSPRCGRVCLLFEPLHFGFGVSIRRLLRLRGDTVPWEHAFDAVGDVPAQLRLELWDMLY